MYIYVIPLGGIKNMVKFKNKKENLLHRTKIVRGQLNTLLKMINDDKYCIDILNNSLSIQKALKKIDILIMEDHLRYCAVNQAKKGETEKLVKELIDVYKYK